MISENLEIVHKDLAIRIGILFYLLSISTIRFLIKFYMSNELVCFY